MTATFVRNGNSHYLIGILLTRFRPSEMDLTLLEAIEVIEISKTQLTDL